jgi:hypothetical protein
MNANELADWLNDPLGYKMGEIAIILRQQQAEIEALKAEIVVIEKNTDYWADKSSKTLTDEEIIKNFLAKQTQLPPEFLKVLNDNLWNLYES